MSLVLNGKQKEAMDKINSFVSQDVDKIFYLMGFCRTGKLFDRKT